MSEVVVARLMNFIDPLTEQEIEQLRQFCRGSIRKGFGVINKGKQIHLTREKALRMADDAFVEDIEAVCQFLLNELGRCYDNDCYEVDY